MYRCPHCKKLTISGLSQLKIPFNGETTCPNCKAEVRIKKKLSNYLVLIYCISATLIGYKLNYHGIIDSFIGLNLLIIVGFIQIRLSEYEEIVKK